MENLVNLLDGQRNPSTIVNIDKKLPRQLRVRNQLLAYVYAGTLKFEGLQKEEFRLPVSGVGTWHLCVHKEKVLWLHERQLYSDKNLVSRGGRPSYGFHKYWIEVVEPPCPGHPWSLLTNLPHEKVRFQEGGYPKSPKKESPSEALIIDFNQILDELRKERDRLDDVR